MHDHNHVINCNRGSLHSGSALFMWRYHSSTNDLVKIARYLAYTRREVERAHASRYALTLKARAAWRTRHGRTHINASGPIPVLWARERLGETGLRTSTTREKISGASSGIEKHSSSSETRDGSADEAQME